MAEEPIRSRQNQWIKRVRKAIDRHESEIVIEGPKMIGDALESGWVPLVILQDEQRSRFHPGALPVDSTLFQELSTTRTTQGVIALFPRPERSAEDLMNRAPARIVVLDSIQDPGNVGTIIRSAAAFELSGVVCLPGTADPWGPKSIRASAGSVLAIPVAQVSTDELLRLVRANEIEVYAADPRARDTAITRTGQFAIVFGSEGRGISPELAEISRGIRIPMSTRVDSLNVAAAAAIVLAGVFSVGQEDPSGWE